MIRDRPRCQHCATPTLADERSFMCEAHAIEADAALAAAEARVVELEAALREAESALRDVSEGETSDYPIEQHHVEEITGPALDKIGAVLAAAGEGDARCAHERASLTVGEQRRCADCGEWLPVSGSRLPEPDQT